MFSFLKKISNFVFSLFFKKKKAKKITKLTNFVKSSKNIISNINGLFSKNTKENTQSNESKSDILKDLSLFILKEFGFSKYINFASYFVRLLR